ncbi:WXG100 family type VII secretion target [Streptomyces sp. NPDC096176]|uniref:WXG100 family type VII secretion target n=1 Tax=Streptomyces sp. NPDC096176 TaxID=3366079 RepID=UPI003826C3D2
MGLGDLIDGGKNVLNSGLGKLEEGWEAGKELVGEGVDQATDVIGDGLEYVGAEGIADRVEDWGDEFASDMGARVGEQQLGETNEANELIHGKPDRIRKSAKHLDDFRAAFDKVGQGMRKLDSSHWKGEAAESFREKFAMQPTKWLQAADACEAAGKALESYADTVKWAQTQAQEAIELYKQGKDTSTKAADAYDRKIDEYRAAVSADRDPGPQPGPFHDPGKADRERAHEILNEARRQRNEAATTAQRLVDAAMAHAPKEPPPLDRATAMYVDGMGAMAIETTHLVGGVVKGTAGVVNFARGLNPLDIYNLTHPAQYIQNVNMTLAGLVSTAAHPERVPGALIESFSKDPAEGIGRLLPELIGTKGLGTLRTVGRVAAKEGMETAAESAVKKGLDDIPAQRVPDPPSHPPTVHDKLHAAADRSVDVSKIPDHAQWRTTDEPLWRNDDRGPDEIFRDGFKPWNNHNTDLDGYVRHNEHSVYVGTTRDPDLGWGSRYRYDVDAPGGIDVNASIPDNIFANEKEIAFPGGVRTENIKGAWEKLPDGTTQYTPNPHYNPHAGAGGSASPPPPAPPNSLLPPGWTQ